MTVGKQVIGRFPVMCGQIQYNIPGVTYRQWISPTVEPGIAVDVVAAQLGFSEIRRFALFPKNDKSGWLLDLAFFASIIFTKTEAVSRV